MLQYIVEEAAAAGIGDVLLITGRGKTSMVDHFDRRPDLEERLQGKGRHRAAGRRRAARASWPRSTPAGRPSSSASATPSATPSRTSATRRSRCCSATSSSTSPSRCCRRCWTCRPGPAASCWPSSRCRPDQSSGTASPRSSRPSTRPVTGEVVKVTGLVEKPKPEEAPSNLAVLGRYVLPGADLRRDPADRAGQRRRDPADRRDGAAAQRGHPGARRRLPGHPLRHRHAAGLPADRRADRLRARRPRRRVPRVAGRVRQQGHCAA